MPLCLPIRRLLTKPRKRVPQTVKCCYQSNIRVSSQQPGNLLRVERGKDGSYTLRTNGTQTDQFSLFRETHWLKTMDGSDSRLMCYIKWFAESENTEYRLIAEEGGLKFVKEVPSKKSQKFIIVFKDEHSVGLKSLKTKQYITCDTNTNQVILSDTLDNRGLFERIIMNSE